MNPSSPTSTHTGPRRCWPLQTQFARAFSTQSDPALACTLILCVVCGEQLEGNSVGRPRVCIAIESPSAGDRASGGGTACTRRLCRDQREGGTADRRAAPGPAGQSVRASARTPARLGACRRHPARQVRRPSASSQAANGGGAWCTSWLSGIGVGHLSALWTAILPCITGFTSARSICAVARQGGHGRWWRWRRCASARHTPDTCSPPHDLHEHARDTYTHENAEMRDEVVGARAWASMPHVPHGGIWSSWVLSWVVHGREV
eukprot:scaffold34200_cov112-Isochrysis_galbana.AAC.1